MLRMVWSELQLHYEFRVQSDLAVVDRADEALQANIAAQQEAAALGR
eukprot:SAG11_NODE_2070_length_3864_cov_1.772112_2_plen_47_part_00